jgi:hypothetical protein
MRMTASEAFQASADSDVNVLVNGQWVYVLSGMRHAGGVAFAGEDESGRRVNFDVPAAEILHVRVVG